MFRLVLEGDGGSGPLGVKAATSFLNERGYRTRGGARWGIGQLHKLLTSPTYKGEYRFNRKVWKTKEDKPDTEQIVVPVDPIIEPSQFDALQGRLKARNPKSTPPRVVSGPILLSGLATCASCGGGMMLRTGKSGRYRYYTCATCAVQGKTACKGRSIPMERLDNLVTERLAETLFTAERVKAILTGLLERQASRSADHTQRMTMLQNKAADSEGRLSRLYQAIEAGVVDFGDETLKGRVTALKAERDQAKAALDRAFAELRPDTRVTEEKIDAFARLMRENVTQGAVPFRRAYLRSVIDQVEVDDDQVRIHGRRDVLERLVMSGAAAAAVPSFVRKWRTRRDLNS
ncbi:recombinase family protein [Rhizobium beringeri]